MPESLFLRQTTDLPGFEIYSEGIQLGGDFAVRSIVVAKGVNKISSARLVLEDGSVSASDFPSSNRDELMPGAEIEIKMGYRGNYETVFKGIVIKHGIKSQGNDRSLLQLELKDRAVKMTLARKNKYFRDLTDGEILEEIVDGYGVEKEIEATNVNHAEMVQYYCTDWDFLVTRAEANGKLVFVNDGKIYVFSPNLSQEAVLTLSYGQNIIEFDAEIDARSQTASISGNAWDFSQQEIVSTDAADPGFPEQGNLSSTSLSEVFDGEGASLFHGGRVSSEELQSWADARYMRSKLSKIKGRIRIIGYAGIKAGDMVELQGLGDRFNGKAFISSVGQVFNADVPWYTDLEIGLSMECLMERFDNVMDKPSAALLPGINGLQIGIVTALQDDPDGENRIQIRLPVVDVLDDGIWARIATLDAGENRGTFFLPEIGDEVIVGFINEDPRDAVVLGMLHSSAKPAPYEASDENHIKAYVSREGIRLAFDDDKKSVCIETPNGNKIALDDDSGSIILEDENGNKVTMDSSGISIESAADFSIKASGDVTIEGINISQKASAQFKAEGSAGAELSSSAVAILKGSLVQIN